MGIVLYFENDYSLRKDGIVTVFLEVLAQCEAKPVRSFVRLIFTFFEKVAYPAVLVGNGFFHYRPLAALGLFL